MSPEVRFSREKATQEGYGGKNVGRLDFRRSLVSGILNSGWYSIEPGKMDGVRVLANASSSTPTKLVVNSGCLLCGTIQSNSRRRTSLSGKVTDLRQRICDSLDITLSGIQLNGYICSDRCFRDVKRLEKLREEAKVLHLSLKEKYSSLNKIKRGVPSDAAISPIATAPLKTPRPATKPDSRVSKSLNFGSKENSLLLLRPSDIQPAPEVPVVLALVQKPLAENVISDGECKGNICKVQVRCYLLSSI